MRRTPDEGAAPAGHRGRTTTEAAPSTATTSSATVPARRVQSPLDIPFGRVQRLHVPELADDVDILRAGIAYAEAGWYVGPIDQRSKHAGSVLGKAWQTKTSNDPKEIAAWFAGTDHGLFLHVGRSGAVVLDVDTPDKLPDCLDAIIRDTQPPFQSTREAEPRRGHYVFAQPADRLIGNGLGKLGKGWGEVRGANGIIVVQPTEHEKPEGRYRWMTTGPVPFSQALTDMLPDATDSADPATDAAVKAFVAEHSSGSKPRLLSAVVQRMTADIDAGGSRHDACRDALAWTMREARAGLYSAEHAMDSIWSVFKKATATEPGRFIRNEFVSLLAWAVAQALTDDPGARAEAVRDRLDDDVVFMSGKAPVEVEQDAATTEHEAVPAAAATAEAEPSSWSPVDLTAVLEGTYVPVEPTLFRRDDGQALLYPGKVHSFHGESESGKSMVAQIACATVLADGGTAVYVDYESDVRTVVGRLLDMGVERDTIAARFAYIRPEVDPNLAWTDWQTLLDRHADLVIVDGVTEALGKSNKSSMDNDEVTKWFRTVPRPLAERTGAAVVLVDHVTKSTDGRGRFAIGAQAKLSALDGAAYGVDVESTLGRGMRGAVRLWCAKDREGAVRPHCGEQRADRSQLAATVVVDSTAGPITWEVQKPEHIIGTERQPFRPTHLMELISRAIEDSPVPVSGNGITKSAEFVPGKATAKAAALRILVAEGYLNRETGPNNTHKHTSAVPFREATDPGTTRSSSSGSDGLSSGGSRFPYREGEPGNHSQAGTGGSGNHSGTTGNHGNHRAIPPGPGPSRDPVGPSGPSFLPDPASAEEDDDDAPF